MSAFPTSFLFPYPQAGPKEGLCILLTAPSPVRKSSKLGLVTGGEEGGKVKSSHLHSPEPHDHLRWPSSLLPRLSWDSVKAAPKHPAWGAASGRGWASLLLPPA